MSKKKVILTTIFTVVVICIVIFGTTYAFLLISNSSAGIAGETMGFDVDLNVTDVYKASKMVPLADNLVSNAIKKSSNKCIDSKGYEVCSLYSLSLTNNGDNEILNGYVKTSSSTYETDNLKYQIYDTNYNAISDVMTVSRTKDEMVYFNNSGTRVNINLGSTANYYLVVWLTETDSKQETDYSKAFSGKIGFESSTGSVIEASFNV